MASSIRGLLFSRQAYRQYNSESLAAPLARWEPGPRMFPSSNLDDKMAVLTSKASTVYPRWYHIR